MSGEYSKHYSVMNKDALEYIARGPGLYLDFTFGAGGHTFALANADEKAEVLAFDQDPEAIKNGQEMIRERGLAERVQLVWDNFENFDQHLEGKKVRGVVLDLGVSSHHFDSAGRGFSFRFDAPLDMRMNPSDATRPSAAELLQTMSFEELSNALHIYGEEPNAKKISRRIIESRESTPISTTKELSDLVALCYPPKLRFGRTNPATRTFQALRILVNDELGVLERVLPKIPQQLEIGGRLAVISFHSLEDRIVKEQFKAFESGNFPCHSLTKRPLVPSEEEILENSRSRSAKMRVLERVETQVLRQKNKYANMATVKKEFS
jgi:16S rRNA (cytosine1402-N4)-methyltransferase